MNVGRVSRALSAIVAVIILAPLPARPAADDLLKLVPGDWPVVARVDISAANASGAYLQSFKQDPQYVESMNAAARGVAKLIAALGIELDPDKGILPWRGEQMAMGMDPAAKPIPRVVIAIASKDRELAKKSLLDAVGSIARMDDPVVHQVSGSEVFIWKLPQENMTPSYAVGDGFVLFAESLDTLKAALAAGEAGTLPAAAARLSSHADDLMAFAIDTTKLMESVAGKSGDGEMDKTSMAVSLAGTVNPHGGIRLDEKGAVLSVFGNMPPMLLMMASQFVSKTEPDSNVAEMLPGNALAAITAAAAQMTAPLQGEFANPDKGRPDMSAAALLLACAKDAAAGLALTTILPTPGYVLAVRARDPAAATAILAEFEKGIAKRGLRKGATKVVSPGRPAMLELLSAKDASVKAGYIGQAGDGIVFGSDWRSAQKTAMVTPETSLASNPGYAGAMALMPGGHAADAWFSLGVVSAMGDLYEAMGARQTSPITKWITDSLKGTNGIAAAVGFSEEEARIQVALGTRIGPGTPVIGMAGMMAAASLAAAVGTRSRSVDIFGGREASRAAQSQANLKQLAIALHMYAADWDGKLPPAGTWPKALEPYVKNPNVFKTPWADDGIIYKFNAKLGGLKMDSVLNAPEVICFFEWHANQPLDPNTISGPDGKMRAAYLDGHVMSLTAPPGAKAFTPQIRKAPAPAKPPARQPVRKR